MENEEILTYVDGEILYVNGKPFKLVTQGRAQAVQVQGLVKWASKYGADIFNELQKANNVNSEGGIGFLLGLLEFVTDDALVDLFRALSGCTQEEAELYFDAATLVEAGIVVYEKHPTVRRLLDRFFSTSDSESDDQPESSMTSELPTDGQMTSS